MAEFKLGRIRFVWKADWVNNHSYYKDDVIRYGGKTYICAVGHTSAADFNTDLEYNPTKWNQMTDGQSWIGDWTTNEFYRINDVVKYGGLLYICNDSHTSNADFSSGVSGLEDATGLEADQSKWSLYTEGFDWKGNWAVFTRYKKNDLVKYGGYTYVCNTAHTSAGTSGEGLELNSGYWDSFNQGFEYKGTWSGSFVRYKVNDVVKQGAGLWICTNKHESTASFIADSVNWSQFVEGIEFEDTWDVGTIYQPGDVVSYGGNQYIAKTNHTGTVPTSGTTDWNLFSQGFKYQADWDLSTSYKVGDVVRLNGYTYLATADSSVVTVTVTATNSTNNYFTVASNADLVVGTAIKFSGTTFGNVAAGATYYVKQIVGLTNFVVTTTPGGAAFTPDTASGSMTAISAAMPPNVDYWARLNSGIKWQGEWVDDNEYVLGDAVRYGANAYICVAAHRSEADDGSTIGAQGGGAVDSRPDRDALGVYWNLLSVGSETAVLTTRGDMVYFGGAGPTRLPVGIEGQVLRSNGTDPEWVSLGYSDHTYYVAPHGENKPFPINGGTLDKPWASIRYACEQIEKGPRNPNTQALLEMNRAFIQREVTSWIDYQISTASVSSIWYNFDYDEYKCERDTGFLVDRLIHDLGHGGNLKMRAAAQTYLNALADGPYSTEEFGTGAYTKLATEGDNDVAAFNYMLSVVESVLNNEAPTVNYQTQMGDRSTAVVEQYINSALIAETGSMATITSLVGIVTDALTNGIAANIPERYVPNNLIQVKAGRYRETLPIIVPAETCVLGDEVRSVNVGPAGSLISPSDAQYTIKSLDRLEEIVGQIVVGTSVTESTGNAESQDQAWPYASSVEQSSIKQLVRAIGYNMDFRLGTTNKITNASPTGYNFSYLVGYQDARTLIAANKTFFQQEVKAFLEATYPTLKYSKTTCLRDVGYIVDALVYDLTYGGNSQSVQAGLAYYQGVGSSLYIDSTELTATLAAYAKLKQLATSIAANTLVTPLQISVAQVRGTGGSAAAITLIGNNLDEMIDIVTNGPSAATLTDPSTAWVSSALTTAYSTLNSAVSTIQTNTIDYINTNFGDYRYNSALCRRDAGYLVDAAYYDAAFGSNFWAVQNGMSYKRAQAAGVLSNQLVQELGSIDYIKGQAATALASNATAVSRSNSAYVEITAILNNTAPSALVYTDTGTANFTYARQQLVTNRSFIVSEMVTWMTANVPGYVALSAAGKALCQRDLGYAIDALAYDVNYGGNLATRNFCRSLFNNITGTGIESVNSGTTYTQLGAVCAQIVRETYAGQDTSGTAASITEAGRMTTLAGNISTVATAGNLSGLVAESAPSISWVSAGIQTAVGTLASSKTDIVAGTLQYISDTYNSFTYNQAKCSRDVATILKAVGYDFMFNSNFQTTKAAYSYLRATATEVFSLGQKTITRAALEYVRTQAIANVGADTTAIARINASMQIIDDIIFTGSNEGSVCQTEIRTADYAALQLERNRAFIVAEISAWMKYNYTDFNDYYNSTTCARDVGMIIDAACYDLITGSNLPSVVAGMSYFRVQSALVTSGQMMQTLEIIEKLKYLVGGYVDTTVYTSIWNSLDRIRNIMENGIAAAPAYTWPDNGTSNATTVSDAAALQTNRAIMVTGIETYLSTTAPYDTVWSSLTLAQKNACKRDVGYIIDAVSFDVQYGGTYQSVIAGSAYYSFGTLEIAAGEKAATLAALTQLGTLMKAYTSAGGDTSVDTLIAVISGIVDTGTIPSTTYPSELGETSTIQSSFTALQAARDTIKTAITTYITDTFSTYSYDVAMCERDIGTFIDALKWDTKWPGNYKSLLASRYYANAVIGSQEENFYLVRNGTGIRNQTMEGLMGDLTPENAYGTSRVTAGAYVSLDPGWGPDDFRTWVTSRSCYIQNCVTFGNAAIGQKIDGALHNGGYKSMVSNDFTQLISDGIGAWVTNNGRAELVSVFTYYSHVGYLAEAGGRIRGTNGNNSYGDFGSVAEGVDVTEVPNTAIVDNKYQFVATVGEVNTDANEIIYTFEFDNAGTDYTEATWTINGAGQNAVAEQDEFRDDGVFQVRLLDNVDDSTSAPEADGNFGGFGYISNANTAQGGTTSQITIAATDGEISTAYIGMKIYLTGGAGVGQYGIIATYNSGTKIATVNKESTGTAGWDHVVAGTTIEAPDASTTYVIEPRVTFTSPSFSSTARTLPSATWVDAAYSEVFATYAGVSGTSSVSGSGATFNVTKKGTKYIVSLKAGGTGYERLETITILGTSLGGATTTNDLVITVTSINSVTGAITAFDQEGYGQGGNFVAVATGTRNIATSTDGQTWSAVSNALPTAAAWTAVAAGKLTTVETAGSFTVGRSYTIVDPGTNSPWTTFGAPNGYIGTTFVATGVGSGDGTAKPNAASIVAVASSASAGAYSINGGATWTSTTLPGASANWTAIGYGAGRWVAIATGSTRSIYSVDGGISWTEGGSLPASTTWTGIAYGEGKWVAVASGGAQSAYSTDGGATWTGNTTLTSSNWTAITYGKGRFVAVSNTSGTTAAYSLDGISWTASTITSAQYTDVHYGQGVFLAVSQSTQAASSEDGINWTSRTMSTAANGFSAGVFGNPNKSGIWASVQRSTAGTVASSALLGCTTKARAYVAQEKIYSIKIVEPGSGYSSAPTITITDPNNLYEAPTQVRIGKGALASPSFTNRGTGYLSASATILSGDGYADFFQDGQYIAIRQLTARPVSGSNVVFGHLPNQTFKLVNVLTLLGSTDGAYTCFFQISPDMKAFSPAPHGTSVTTRIRYSQVRLTGHDFLDIGTGSFTESNYPSTPLQDPIQNYETVDSNGGRVFFTSTDQDGNFRVGDLFTIEQSTGVATLNADAFNIAGLQELSLGQVSLGGGSASITEFSTDPFFTANSDSVVPTQRAIKAYIASQIGGGGASLNVNSVTAGSVYIASNQITTTTNTVIYMQAKFNFQGGVVGLPISWNYFLT